MKTTYSLLFALAGMSFFAPELPSQSSAQEIENDESDKTDQALDEPAKKEGRAIVRTRKQVRMLDAIYKGSIVMITKNYVHDEDDMPAGTAFKQIFAIAKENGFHEVRLLDATGNPYNSENVAKDAFEKDAIKQLRKGESWVEKVEKSKGKRILRVATPIPVVMDKCVSCHDNYADLQPGVAIGALGYSVPIE